jgi:DNA-binding CsgD family transcriptional regulator
MQPLAGASIKRHMALARLPLSITRKRADEEAGDAAADGVLHQLIEGLTRDSRTLEARFRALEGVADRLHAEVEASAQRLRLLITQLELAEERLRREPLAAANAKTRGAPSTVRARAAPRRSLGERKGSDAPRAQESLCAREREVLKLLTEGMRSPSIAARLGIKTATVGVHRRNIMRKLNLHSVAALTKYALRAGLTSL